MTLFGFISHLFIPNQSNNHRSKLIHPQAFLFYVVLLLLISVSFKVLGKVAPSILGVATNISISDLFAETNRQRQQKGLQPLFLNEKLSQAAQAKANDMITDNYWAHYNPNGKTPWDFIVASDYQYSVAGENLARDFNDSSSIIEAWMNSPTHKDNLLKSEYEEIGFAVVNGNLNGHETTLVVQIFATPQEPRPQVPADLASKPQKEEAVNANSQISQNRTIAGLNSTPLVDKTIVNKYITNLLLVMIAVIFALDGLIIWRRKTIRVSGHNIAHIIFFLTLISAVWISYRGTIL